MRNLLEQNLAKPKFVAAIISQTYSKAMISTLLTNSEKAKKMQQIISAFIAKDLC